MRKISDRLKISRENKGVSQTQVYKDTGINNKTLSGYERGISEPDLDTVRLLAEYYDVSLDYLLGKTDNIIHYKSDKEFPKSESFIDYVVKEAEKAGFNLRNKSKEEIAKIIVKALKIDEINKSN